MQTSSKLTQTTMFSDTVLHARNVDGKFVSAQDVQHMLENEYQNDRKQLRNKLIRMRLTCVDDECHDLLTFRQAHKKSINGVLVHWSAAFVHQNTDKARACSRETRLHKHAKFLVATYYSAFNFVLQCPCGTIQDIDTSNHTDTTNITCTQEQRWQKYALDVGVCSGDQVVGAVEICVTNPCSDEKVGDMTRANLAWVEVDARELVDTHARSPDHCTLRVLRAGTTLCASCISDKELAQGIWSARQKLMTSQVTAAQLSKTRKQAREVQLMLAEQAALEQQIRRLQHEQQILDSTNARFRQIPDLRKQLAQLVADNASLKAQNALAETQSLPDEIAQIEMQIAQERNTYDQLHAQYRNFVQKRKYACFMNDKLTQVKSKTTSIRDFFAKQ